MKKRVHKFKIQKHKDTNKENINAVQKEIAKAGYK